VDVAVTGASGLVGRALVAALEGDGARVRRLVRPGAPSGPATVSWDPAGGAIDAAGLEGVEAVVHLAGVGIGDRRWTDAHKRAVLDSRVRGTGLLARTLAGLAQPPKVLVSASAIGIYGDRGDEVLTEAGTTGEGFLADVCRAWEAATAPAEAAGIRVAHVRSGIVLSPQGGALRKQLPLFRIGLGGRFGRGRQWQSWISLDDEVGAIRHLLDHPVAGPVNLTAPHPVRNAEFATTLGRVLRRPAVVPVPPFGPALLLGRELAHELLFTSQRVVPEVLAGSGYRFRHQELEPALRHLLGRPAVA